MYSLCLRKYCTHILLCDIDVNECTDLKTGINVTSNSFRSALKI